LGSIRVLEKSWIRGGGLDSASPQLLAHRVDVVHFERELARRPPVAASAGFTSSGASITFSIFTSDWPSPVTVRLFQKPRLIGRPPDDRFPDFPLVTEGIENATELPAVLDGHGGGLGRSRGHRLLNERMRIVDNEESTAGSPVDAAWIEALHGRRRGADPEGSTPHGELGDDVIAFTYEMKRACTERRFVERDRFARFVNPKFRLDSRHEPRR
jgi:hypothetical protein